MTVHPILFSAPMIRALLDGRKTQTRRTLTPQPYKLTADELLALEGEPGEVVALPHSASKGIFTPQTSKYASGSRLWVRETWQPHSLYADRAPRDIPPSIVFYKADGGHSPSLPWKPSMFMPRWASRLTLVVTDVRLQRLQSISEADAKAEGAKLEDCWPTYRQSFEALWNAINGPDAWDANPWVVAVSFTVHQCNIDRMEA